ncbi:MobA/MobL family protein [Sporolituus thermophilus]|uniref:MobA/MobL family protein n=1 Tax=Sporolituus thermophilus DSM 23256 TaxID=1123285 RepID=A0A1G7MI38_9FIRM|nr:MobA/MobL family protein [Sporolituus thermophilus]SDF61367.1 MobA/MobL family protein [Sporolituus thermophilus DSM 23256]
MATYHFEMKPASQLLASAQAKYEYITRTGRYRAGQRKNDLIHVESQNMPEWAKENPAEFWEAADRYERANGNTYRQIIAALPVELTHEEHVELVREFVQKHLTNHTVTFAIHENAAFLATALGDNFDGEHILQKNPHVHIIFSERVNDGIERPAEQYFRRYNPKQPELGGAKKERSWSSLDRAGKLRELRESWTEIQNRALERAGHEARVDHRTLAEQGVDREPEPRIPVLYLRQEVREAIRYAWTGRSFVEMEEKRREYIQSRGDIRLQLIFLRRQLAGVERSLSHAQAQAVANSLELIDRRATAPALMAIEQAPAHILRRLPAHPAAASRLLAPERPAQERLTQSTSSRVEGERQPASQAPQPAPEPARQQLDPAKYYSKEEILAIVEGQVRRFEQLISQYMENAKKLEKEKVRTDEQCRGIALARATKGIYTKVKNLEKEGKEDTEEYRALRNQLGEMLKKPAVQKKALEVFSRVQADSRATQELVMGYINSIKLLGESTAKLLAIREKLVHADVQISRQVRPHDVLQSLSKALEKAEAGRSQGRSRVQVRLGDDDDRRRGHGREF